MWSLSSTLLLCVAFLTAVVDCDPFLNIQCPSSTGNPCTLYSVPDITDFSTQTNKCTLPNGISGEEFPACAVGYSQASQKPSLYCVFWGTDTGNSNTMLYTINPTGIHGSGDTTCLEYGSRVTVTDGDTWQPAFSCMAWSSLKQALLVGTGDNGKITLLTLGGQHSTLTDVCGSETLNWLTFGDDEEILYYQCSNDDRVCLLNITSNATDCGPTGELNDVGGATYNFADGTIYVQLVNSDTNAPCVYTLDTDTLSLTVESCSNGGSAKNLGGFTYSCSIPDDTATCESVCSMTFTENCTKSWQTCDASEHCVCANTVKTTCTAGYECGTEDNYCGGIVACGDCLSDETCSSSHKCESDGAAELAVPFLFGLLVLAFVLL